MKTTEIFESVNLNEIVTSNFNVRVNFREQSIQELANSMSENGLINPLTLRVVGKNQYEIICGERRFKAAQLLGWKKINAYIKDVTTDQAQELCLIENIQREDISPIEEAQAYQKLYETTNDIKELITRTGKSESYIRVRLQLNSLIPEIANLLNQEEISLGSAAVICSYSEEIQREINERFYDKEAYNNWFDLNKEEVRKRIESNYTTQLDQFKFDQNECINCKDNTANFSLFCEGCGKCVNQSCLAEKNATYLLSEAIRIKQENPLVVLCTSPYRTTNNWVIERLKIQELEIQENANCNYYPQEPKELNLTNIKTEKEKERLTKIHQNRVLEYNKQMEALRQKEEQGRLTRYAVILDKEIEFQYREHEVKNESEELQKQLKALNDKDKRNQELKVINTIKDAKTFMEQKDIPITKEISKREEKFIYFFMLNALNPNHYTSFGLPAEMYYLGDKQKKEIVEQGLSEEQKTIIKRDFLLKNFDSYFGGGTTSEFYIQFMKEHFPEEITKIEKKYEDVYNKRFVKIKEQISTIDKQLKKAKKLPKKGKNAA